MLYRLAPAAAAVALLLAACGGGGDDPAGAAGPAAADDARAQALAATGRARGDDGVAGEVLVKLKVAADLPAVLAAHRLTQLSQFGSRPIYRLSHAAGGSVAAVLAALRADTRVSIAELNFRSSAPEARVAAVWAIGRASAYRAQWAPQALNLAAAHASSQGAGIRVAVLDTGVDAAHPALAGRLLPGRDFVDADDDPAEAGGVGRAGWGHGTHAAGLVALAAPAAQIVPLRVLDADGRGTVWTIAEALLHAVDPDGSGATDDGAHVVNLSLGTLQPTRILDAVVELLTCSDDDDNEDDDDWSDPGYAQDQERCNRHHGSVVIAAAGNGASATERQYPAAEDAEGALSVAASNAGSRLASFSNRGSWIRIAAPGDGLTSSIPGGGWGVWSGTSMAAPLTAGVAALVLAANPDWKPVDVTKRLMDRSAALCGTALRRVDAAAAVLDRTPAENACR